MWMVPDFNINDFFIIGINLVRLINKAMLSHIHWSILYFLDHSISLSNRKRLPTTFLFGFLYIKRKKKPCSFVWSNKNNENIVFFKEKKNTISNKISPFPLKLLFFIGINKKKKPTKYFSHSLLFEKLLSRSIFFLTITAI